MKMQLLACDDNQLLCWMAEGKKFICVGVGQLLHELCQRTGLEKAVRVLADNDRFWWGKSYPLCGREILYTAPDNLSITDDDIVLLTTPYYFLMKRQLEQVLGCGKSMKVFFCPSVADSYYWEKADYWQGLKQEKKILLRSGATKYVKGFDYSDNAKALYEYLIEHGYNKNWHIIWFVHDAEAFPELAGQNNVEVISYEWETSEDREKRERYFYHLATARYAFFTDTHFWLRYGHKDLIRVNLWHGCGFKDRKSKTGPLGQFYDYMTVTSPMYADIHAKEFGVDRSRVLVTGLAKEDWLFKPLRDELWQLFPVAKAKKYIFWTPTFRMAADGLERLNEYELASETGLPVVSDLKLAKQLNEVLAAFDIAMIIKLHPVQRNTLIAHLRLSHICVLENADITERNLEVNMLLTKADAMISDYSSIAVDYLLLDRPLAFMLEDVRAYEDSRGFVFDNIRDYLPGKELYTFADLLNFVCEIAAGVDGSKDKRRSLTSIMHAYPGGESCKRILQMVGLGKE